MSKCKAFAHYKQAAGQHSAWAASAGPGGQSCIYTPTTFERMRFRLTQSKGMKVLAETLPCLV